MKDEKEEFETPPIVLWILVILWMSWASYRYGVQSTKEKYNCTSKVESKP